MKILYIQKEGGIFGAEAFHLIVVPTLIRLGISIEFLRLYTDYQLGKDSDFVLKLQAMNVPVYQVNIGRVPGIGDVREVAKIIRKGKYDIVHSHLIHGDFYAALVKTLYKVSAKFVSTKHGYDNAFTAKFGFDASKQTNTPYFMISRWAESKFDKTYTISKGLLNFFLATGMTTAAKMEMIYYGLDLPELPDTAGGREHRLAKYQFCIAGRLIEFKGHSWAFEAIAELKKKRHDIKLVVIGSGIYEQNLRDKVKALGIENEVEFLGYRKDVGLWMKHSDVVLVPSRSEGFGVVFLDAFNARTPVVAFNVPASNELIIDGETGLLARPYDTSDLAAKIDTLLTDKALAENYAAKAYDRYRREFSLGRMVDEIVAFYKRVVEK